jgi:hypothetical protein
MSQHKGTSKFFLLENVEENSDSGSRLDLRVGIIRGMLAMVMNPVPGHHQSVGFRRLIFRTIYQSDPSIIHKTLLMTS